MSKVDVVELMTNKTVINESDLIGYWASDCSNSARIPGHWRVPLAKLTNKYLVTHIKLAITCTCIMTVFLVLLLSAHMG